jgi:integrase
MKFSIRFYLNNYNSEKSNICLYLIANNQKLKVSIGESVPVTSWNKNRDVVLPTFPNSTYLNNRISEISSYCNREFLVRSTNSSFDIHLYFQNIKEFIKGKPLDKTQENNQKNFYKIWDEFIEFRMKNKTVNPKVILLYKRVRNHLYEFNKNVTFEKIDERLLIEFRTFLFTKKNYQVNGAATHFKNGLFVFLNWCTKNGISKNMKYKNFKVNLTERNHNVYLSLSELRVIKDLPNLQPYLDNARSWLMIMSYTGLRISDAKRLNNSNIDLDKKRIDLIMQKTNSRVVVPIMKFSFSSLEKLINKEVYKVSDQKLNEYYKELCKIAGFDQLTTVTTYIPNKSEVLKPKYELISNHCFRRSFATNCLSLGIKPSLIMKITGHKTFSSFEKYVGFTIDDAVDEVGKVWDNYRI